MPRLSARGETKQSKNIENYKKKSTFALWG